MRKIQALRMSLICHECSGILISLHEWFCGQGDCVECGKIVSVERKPLAKKAIHGYSRKRRKTSKSYYYKK